MVECELLDERFSSFAREAKLEHGCLDTVPTLGTNGAVRLLCIWKMRSRAGYNVGGRNHMRTVAAYPLRVLRVKLIPSGQTSS